MPNVFTSELWSNDQSFENFITKIAAYHAKDDTGWPADVPLPNKADFSDYYIKKLTDLLQELKRHLNMSLTEMNQEYDKFRIPEQTRYYDEYRDYLNREKRLVDMLKLVKGWGAPKSLETLKQDAIKEIEMAIKENVKPVYPYTYSSAEEWHAYCIEGLSSDIKYYAKHLNEEATRVREINKFLQEFKQAMDIYSMPASLCMLI